MSKKVYSDEELISKFAKTIARYQMLIDKNIYINNDMQLANGLMSVVNELFSFARSLGLSIDLINDEVFSIYSLFYDEDITRDKVKAVLSVKGLL